MHNQKLKTKLLGSGLSQTGGEGRAQTPSQLPARCGCQLASDVSAVAAGPARPREQPPRPRGRRYYAWRLRCHPAARPRGAAHGPMALAAYAWLLAPYFWDLASLGFARLPRCSQCRTTRRAKSSSSSPAALSVSFVHSSCSCKCCSMLRAGDCRANETSNLRPPASLPTAGLQRNRCINVH